MLSSARDTPVSGGQHPTACDDLLTRPSSAYQASICSSTSYRANITSSCLCKLTMQSSRAESWHSYDSFDCLSLLTKSMLRVLVACLHHQLSRSTATGAACCVPPPDILLLRGMYEPTNSHMPAASSITVIVEPTQPLIYSCTHVDAAQHAASIAWLLRPRTTANGAPAQPPNTQVQAVPSATCTKHTMSVVARYMVAAGLPTVVLMVLVAMMWSSLCLSRLRRSTIL